MTCPECGGNRLETTLMGFMGVDCNKARCHECGWKGKAYQCDGTPRDQWPEEG